MIVKLKYEDVRGNTLRLGINGKKVLCYMRVAVDASNVVEAVSKFKTYKNVVAFDYTGDMQSLHDLDTTTPICVKFNLDNVDSTIDDIIGNVPPNVRVIIKLPEDFSNMRIIHDYSTKYNNIRFCGGNFLRLEGCSLGCVGVNDIPRKISSTKIKLTCQGCACAFENVNINDFDFVEFTDEVVPVKEVKPKVAKGSTTTSTHKSKAKKKPVSSLLSLAKANGVMDF